MKNVKKKKKLKKKSQWVKMLSSKPDHLDSIFRIHRKEKIDSYKLSSDPHAQAMVLIHPHTYIHECVNVPYMLAHTHTERYKHIKKV